MIHSSLVTCLLCRSYYADPRQIPCSHSFCFDCLSGRFDEETLILICPKCDRTHQYHSREDFEYRCIPDGFLASIVTQFKKKQSRSTLISRPSSSMSFRSSVYTPTPSIYFQLQRSSSVLSQVNSRSFIAKCQSCYQRNELTVCQHCENVLCFKCIEEHQSLVNDQVKYAWQTCQMTFQNIEQQSDRFDSDFEQCKDLARQYQKLINERATKLIQLVDQQKNIYLHMIEKHRRMEKSVLAYEQIIDEYETIEQHFHDGSVEKNDEIEHFRSQLDHLTNYLDHHELKFPLLTLPEPLPLCCFFGIVDFLPLNESSSIDLPSADDYIQMPSNQYHRTISIPSPKSFSSRARKEFLWQLDFKSVPYFIRLYASRLFVCDKYGFLSIYQWQRANDRREKPLSFHHTKLFHDQVIIDSFVVHPYGILVVQRKSPEVDQSIYCLFNHDGYPIFSSQSISPNPLRDLTMDFDTNLLWSFDEQQNGLVYCPMTDQRTFLNSPVDVLQHRFVYIQFPKSNVAKKFAVSNDLVALLDPQRQVIEIYDKRTQEKFSQYVNDLHQTRHICWEMALLSNQSLLIKLDDIETLKTGPSKHFYLHLDIYNPQEILGIIEENETFAMLITPTDEILIGSRTDSTGTVRCYL